MKCRYFERLLFENSSGVGHELTPTQTRTLQTHLQECPDCRTLETDWDRVNTLFAIEIERQDPAPRAGFTRRWQEKLAEERKAEERQQVWSALSFFLGAAGMCFSMLVVWAILSEGTPLEWFRNSIQQMAVWLVVWSALQRVFEALQSLLTDETGLALLTLITLMAGGLAAAWGISLQRLIKIRRMNS